MNIQERRLSDDTEWQFLAKIVKIALGTLGFAMVAWFLGTTALDEGGNVFVAYLVEVAYRLLSYFIGGIKRQPVSVWVGLMVMGGVIGLTVRSIVRRGWR
ncbi:hypothetical protein A2121_00335 [Candidatus Nomurabacteria bacterium GWB1_40_6]|uniref:Uncharacterized protein n=1 Tax=Candidatus Nomurabacteria bacterium GWB1_40_6 TaxID=1801727 RepID=A0A1F6TNG2_9BACT|nr:MAG: hypothetical protein A2121_00335 [Candidatus Nomurabacteria bacterium GWB1_40_6]